MSKMYAYCRGSTKEQNLDRQLEAMKEFGVEEENIFSEKISGKDFRQVRPGDRYPDQVHRPPRTQLKQQHFEKSVKGIL